VRNGLPDHWRESYVCETGKSMKAMELVVAQEDCCCNISIALIDPVLTVDLISKHKQWPALAGHSLPE
jgi:hypothetical protein